MAALMKDHTGTAIAVFWTLLSRLIAFGKFYLYMSVIITDTIRRGVATSKVMIKPRFGRTVSSLTLGSPKAIPNMYSV